MSSRKIAYLVPTYNGGPLLAETVNSPAAAKLPPASYQVIVVDNLSTDGSTDALPSHDSQGVPIRLARNEVNLGRIGNLNRAMEIAHESGFEFATYLMVGDLVYERGMIELAEYMDVEKALMGMGSFRFVTEQREFLRMGRSLQWNISGGIRPRPLVAQSVAIGAQIIGIVQGNLYRISTTFPRFDEKNPSLTDHVSTWRYLLENEGLTVYLDKPVFDWRSHSGRYHKTMDLVENSMREKDLVTQVCALADVHPDWTKIKSAMLVRLIFHLREGYTAKGKSMDTLRAFLAWARNEPGHFSPIASLQLLARMLIKGRPYPKFRDTRKPYP